MFLDFSSRMIENDMAFASPNLNICIRNISQSFDLPMNQIKVIIVRINSRQIIKVSGNKLEENTNIYNKSIENIVRGIKSDIFYKRVSIKCGSCSFFSNCKTEQ